MLFYSKTIFKFQTKGKLIVLQTHVSCIHNKLDRYNLVPGISFDVKKAFGSDEIGLMQTFCKLILIKYLSTPFSLSKIGSFD